MTIAFNDRVLYDDFRDDVFKYNLDNNLKRQNFINSGLFENWMI